MTEKFKRSKGKSFFNRSLERALQILSVFSFEKREFTLGELSQTLHIPKATVHRLCSTLIDYGFLKYDENAHTYSLGLTLFTLGSIVSASFSIRKAASRHLTELQSKTDETVYLSILQDDELVCIDKREDLRKPIRLASDIGTRRPPIFGMLGQVLMAYLEDKEMERLLANYPLRKFTKRSITDKTIFINKLRKIREQGFNIEKGEAVNGSGIGVAAPIRDHTGQVVAAVGVGTISKPEGKKVMNALTNNVCEAAKRISAELGYDGGKEKRLAVFPYP